MDGELPKRPYNVSVDDTFRLYETDADRGLRASDIEERRDRFGFNLLADAEKVKWWQILLKQLINAMVIVLFSAMVASFGIQDYIEAGVLAVVIVLNVSIGFVNEYRAEKKMDTLKSLAAPTANVLRDGKIINIPSKDLVIGDVVVLTMGDTVPADLRLFETMNLSCEEKNLTGESEPVTKETDSLDAGDVDVGPGDRINMAFATTTVASGRGRGVVVWIGMDTVVGEIARSAGHGGKDEKKQAEQTLTPEPKKKTPEEIAEMLEGKSRWVRPLYSVGYRIAGSRVANGRVARAVLKFLGFTEGTPLQRRLSMLAYGLLLFALLLAAIVFGVNGGAPPVVVMYAISTGIAVIPEALVAVLTITMVASTHVMSGRKVIVRDLNALEALGGVTNICSDKTGTLTQGEMIVKNVFLPGGGDSGRVYTVRGTSDPNDPTAGRVTYFDRMVAEEDEEGENQKKTDNTDIADEGHRELRHAATSSSSRNALKFKLPTPSSRRTGGQDRDRTRSRSRHEEPRDGSDLEKAVSRPVNPGGGDDEDDGEERATITPALEMFLVASALCNLATVRRDEDDGDQSGSGNDGGGGGGGGGGKWLTTGAPTEIALQVFAHRFGLGKMALRAKGWREVHEFPFESAVKRMTSIYDWDRTPNSGEGRGEEGDSLLADELDHARNSLVLTKGAAERIVDICSHVGFGNSGDGQEGRRPMNDDDRADLLAQVSEFAGRGQRVLAVAYREWDGRYEKPDPAAGRGGSARKQSRATAGPASADAEKKAGGDDEVAEAIAAANAAAKHAGPSADARAAVERDLTLLGLAGIYDPPRPESFAAVRECAAAGITVHMLTGDHAETATAIAREVGIVPPRATVMRPPPPAAGGGESGDMVLPAANKNDWMVMKASDFDSLSDAQIDALPELPRVVARCAPDTKVRMIAALHRRGGFVAMTGDGVNDAPSLSMADVGVAMGGGSDVAKGASQLVIQDDRFDSIVGAVREGRRVFDNVQRFILHLLTSNVGEVILLIGGLGLRDERGFSVFPISPLAILWINLLTSSGPAFGLGRLPASPDAMRHPPRTRRGGVFTAQVWADMAVMGLLMGLSTLALSYGIVFGHGVAPGGLGAACNTTYAVDCDPVFRSRSAVFLVLTWTILATAYMLKDLRRSMFAPVPGPQTARQMWFNLYAGNRLLFWFVALGLVLSVFPVAIPHFNTEWFKQSDITTELAGVFGACLFYIVGVELWKLLKRSRGWLLDHEPDVHTAPWLEDPDAMMAGRLSRFSTLSRSRAKSQASSLSLHTTAEEAPDKVG